MMDHNLKTRIAVGSLAVFVVSLGALAVTELAGRNVDVNAEVDAPEDSATTEPLSQAPTGAVEGPDVDGFVPPPSETGIAVDELPGTPNPLDLAPSDMESPPVEECGPNQVSVVSKLGGTICLEPGDPLPIDPTVVPPPPVTQPLPETA